MAQAGGGLAQDPAGHRLIWRILDTGEPIYSRKLSVDEVRRRITDYHQPYQKAVKDALDATHAHFGSVWHLNCHSMPAVSSVISEEGPGKPRADFVLGDRDGTTCEPEFTAFVARFLADMGYEVKVNDPYKGVELVRAFSDPADGRHSLSVPAMARRHYPFVPAFLIRSRYDLESSIGEIDVPKLILHGDRDDGSSRSPTRSGSSSWPARRNASTSSAARATMTRIWSEARRTSENGVSF